MQDQRYVQIVFALKRNQSDININNIFAAARTEDVNRDWADEGDEGAEGDAGDEGDESDDASDDDCGWCNQSEPTGKENCQIKWISCDKCNKWYHM